MLSGQPAMHEADCHHEGKAETRLYFSVRPVMLQNRIMEVGEFRVNFVDVASLASFAQRHRAVRQSVGVGTARVQFDGDTPLVEGAAVHGVDCRVEPVHAGTGLQRHEAALAVENAVIARQPGRRHHRG